MNRYRVMIFCLKHCSPEPPPYGSTEHLPPRNCHTRPLSSFSSIFVARFFNHKMRSSRAWMKSSPVVRASDCQCRSILRHSEVWGAADEGVLNKVLIKTKQKTRTVSKNQFICRRSGSLCRRIPGLNQKKNIANFTLTARASEQWATSRVYHREQRESP